MREVRFIHCADLHIASPFKGLSEEMPQEFKDILRQSTFRSFGNIVELAIKKAVDCILVSGDIYDAADKNLQAQIRFRDGLRELSDAGIHGYVIHGNHDPLDSWSATLKWADKVKIFGGDKVERCVLEKSGQPIAQIYGISFPKRDINDNLALQFERQDDDIPAIAVLHTNVGMNTGHEPYSPATIEELVSKGMDYWALGHVHKYEILKTANPAIVYPGNSQARNPRETGAKGCCLVTLYPNGDSDVEFISTDVLRYRSDNLDISDCSDVDDVMNLIKERCQEISDDMEGRHAIIRISLTGRTDLHPELQRGDNVREVLTEVREFYEGREPWIWLEKLTLNTQGSYDLEVLRRGNEFIADIIALFDELENEESDHWTEIQEVLKAPFATWQGQRYLEGLGKEELLALATESRNWLLDRLITSK